VWQLLLPRSYLSIIEKGRAGRIAENDGVAPAKEGADTGVKKSTVIKKIVLVVLPIILLFQIAFATRQFLSEIWEVRGNAVRVAGDVGQAREMYERSLRYDAKDYKTLHLLGAALVAEGDTGRAVDVLDRCVQLAPYHPLALDLLAIAYLRQGELEKASGAIARALDVVPISANVHTTAGRIEDERGLYDEAINQYREALRLGYSPESEVLRAIANAHYKNGDGERAVETASEAVAGNPKDPLNYLVRGQLLIQTKQLQEAVTVLRRAVELFAESPSHASLDHRMRTHIILAGTYLDLDLPADAAQQLFEMQKLDNTDPRIPPLIEAVAKWLDTKSANVVPAERARAWFLLSRSFLAAEKLDPALEALRHVCETQEAPARLRATAHAQTAGLMAGTQRKFDEAIAELDRAQQIDPGLAEIRQMRENVLRYQREYGERQ